MPLIKKPSKKAFEHNIKAEIHAGKPQDQALAIAYNVQRKNKGKKMAHGGEVDREEEDDDRSSMINHRSIVEAIRAKEKMMAEGGMVDLEENEEDEPTEALLDEQNHEATESFEEDLDSVNQPEDSNEHGEPLQDELDRSMVDIIRKKMKKLR